MGTHAKHHRRTNHLTEGESHVPSTGIENGLSPNNERLSFYATLHENIGDDAFAVFQIWSHLHIGWPLYLMGLASTGRLDHKGRPLDGRIADHFRPDSPMFPPKVSFKIGLSTVATVAQIAGLMYLSLPSQYGFMSVVLWFGIPGFSRTAGWYYTHGCNTTTLPFHNTEMVNGHGYEVHWPPLIGRMVSLTFSIMRSDQLTSLIICS